MMMMKPSTTSQDTELGATTAETPFMMLQDDGEHHSAKDMNRLKLSVVLIGVIVGVALQSLSWTSRATFKRMMGMNDNNIIALDILIILLSCFIMPMVLSELMRVAFRSVVALMTSQTRGQEDVFDKLFLHVQSRLAAGIIGGALITLQISDLAFGLWYNLVYTVQVVGVLILWCCYFEKKVLDEAATIRMASDLRESEESPLLSVY